MFCLTLKGWKSIAVPGALKGIWELHQRHGKLKWRQLITDAVIEDATHGVAITHHIAATKAFQKSLITFDTYLG